MKNYNIAAAEFVESLTDAELKKVARMGGRVYAYTRGAEHEQTGFHLSAGNPSNNEEHPVAEKVLAREYRLIVHSELECAQSNDDPTNDPNQLRCSIEGLIDQELHSKLEHEILTRGEG